MLKPIKRTLDLTPILKRKSLFLMGPRQTGKTTFLKNKYPEALYIDLLDIDVQRDLNLDSGLLEKMIKLNKKKMVIIDEIQKMPSLLDEVHRLIEKNKELRFILTGSSARKIKRSNANLLGGRAASVSMTPLSLHEILQQGLSIDDYYQYGGLPSLVGAEHPKSDLKDYVELYLTQEIQTESIVRNIQNFSRFIYFAATTNCEQINYTNLGNDAQISPRTVQDYYQILEDTLIGNRLAPYQHTSRKPVSIDKFYFFDVGVANYLKNKLTNTSGGELFGKIFEHTVYCELRSFCLANSQEDYEMNYWRSHTKLEVDFILNKGKKILAVEVKASKKVSLRQLNGLSAFMSEQPDVVPVVVCQTKSDYEENGVMFLNIESFVKKLWGNELI